MFDCPFCNPAVIENQKIYETETEYVLYNIRKTNRGRCEVVPKRHVKNIRELSEKETASILNTVKLVSQKLFEYLKPDGFNFGFNEGERAGQAIDHFHFHIFPRFKDDSMPEFHLFHGGPKTKKNLTPDELQKLTKEFRKLF
jgi:histidine triad (HIT) family protein